MHPELGITYLGSRGDIWDAQKDMAAAFYGSLLCMGLLLAVRIIRRLRAEAAGPDGARPLLDPPGPIDPIDPIDPIMSPDRDRTILQQPL